MSLWPCRWFRRRRRKESSPESYVIPGTKIVADRLQIPPTGSLDVHEQVRSEIRPSESLWLKIRFYLVRDEFLEGPDGRMRVPFAGQTYAVHGYAIGNRIILTPHGATSLATIEHEIRHVYGEHHDERGHWKEDA